MTKTPLEELFGDFGKVLDTFFGDQPQPKYYTQRERPEPTTKEEPIPPQDESKLIAALSKCTVDYKPALTNFVAQTATHVKQTANPELTGAHVRAALYTRQIQLAQDVLDAIVKPTTKEVELRAIIHYEAGNYPLCATLFDRVAGNYNTTTARFAHTSTIHRAQQTDTRKYQHILAGLEHRVAPAAEIMGVVHFNHAEFDQAALYLDVALTLAPTAQRKLNLMTARAARSDFDKVDVLEREMPQLFQEFQYTGTIRQATSDVERKQLAFPHIKVSNLYEVACKIYQG